MNSSDLRVGNLVQYNCFPMHVVAVYQDGTVYCDFEGNEGDVWEFDKNNPCVGIELTEKDVKQYGHFNLIKVNDEYFVCFGNYKTQIKYLHELQNYYYLVNHKEL